MTSPDLDRAEFPASFPPIMSALLFGSDGVRIKLDIPETHRAEAVKLTQWQGMVLRVTIEPEIVTQCNNETEKESKRSIAQMDSGRVSLRRNR